MKIGYCRVSKADGSQKFDLQMDSLKKEGVKEENIFLDRVSGGKSDRPGLAMCIRTLRDGDILIVWALDRLGRNLRHLLNILQEIESKKASIKVLSGYGQGIDTATPMGRMFFQVIGMLAEYEREVIRERTIAGLKAARARGRHGGRRFALNKAKVRLAQAAMGRRDTVVADLCRELGIKRATLYRYVGPDGTLREMGQRVMEQ